MDENACDAINQAMKKQNSERKYGWYFLGWNDRDELP